MSILLHSKKKRNKLKSILSPDAESLFSMTENESDMKTGKKQKGQCDFSLSSASSALFFVNNSRHGDGGGADKIAQNTILGKNVDNAVSGSDLAKLKQETRSIRSRALSYEKIDFYVLLALAFHVVPRKKSD